jgi:zinc transport system permease protein
LVAIWNPLFAATVSQDIAEAEGKRPLLSEAVLLLLTAITIAIAIKVVGVLLITALLIIPAATARRFASGPEIMALMSAGIGGISVIAGLTGSLHLDTPSGPSIVVAALVCFLFGLCVRRQMRRTGSS